MARASKRTASSGSWRSTCSKTAFITAAILYSEAGHSRTNRRKPFEKAQLGRNSFVNTDKCYATKCKQKEILQQSPF